ncbi:hypothetical protein VSR68_37585 [Paraburkholderia phymatum]|uniref:hypothetical protein n=1 Tax=Paraburkholderia phymatum TaxID=148447 RepID=UPI0031771C4B
MKKMLLAAGLVASVLFAGCAGVQVNPVSLPATPAVQSVLTAAQKFHNAVTAACNVLMPTIEPLTPLFATQPGFVAFNADLSLACAANFAIDLASVNNLIGSSISAAQAVVPNVSALDKTQQVVVVAALGAFKGALQNALAAYVAAAPVATQ